MDGDRESSSGYGEGHIIHIPCEGVVTCVECCPYDFCDYLFCFCSHSNSELGQTSHQLTIARFYPKREVGCVVNEWSLVEVNCLSISFVPVCSQTIQGMKLSIMIFRGNKTVFVKCQQIIFTHIGGWGL